ncbi:MAG: biopolymer transporter ExbD [Proteobacteria bacterium]|nr:biopolymer transporter ExbD [Pseudomonadota bacterium]
MAMSVGPSGEAMCDINTTPLIDVMLVLLVTLIVSLPVMTHAVKLDMPNPNQPPPPQDQVQPEVIDLEIDSDGTVVWNGTPVTGLDQLEGYFHNEAAKDPQPEVHLRPDRRAKYGVVATVLAAAQRNHMVKIGFTNVAQFGN